MVSKELAINRRKQSFSKLKSARLMDLVGSLLLPHHLHVSLVAPYV
jgi:hypothetical protein